jgi:hypothetical protein
MNFTVVWRPSALRDLADVWTNAPDRNAVTAASRAIDLRLGRDPLSQGEAREGNLRILFVPPLAVIYQVEPDDCRVTVLDVWLYPP